MSRHRYPTEISRVFERTTAAKLQEALTLSDNVVNLTGNENNETDPPKQQAGNQKVSKISISSKAQGDGNRSKQSTLKAVLGEALGYGTALSEHIILNAGLIPNMKLCNDKKLDDNSLDRLMQAVANFEDWLEDVIFGTRVPEGYILMQKKDVKKEESEAATASEVAFSLICFKLKNCYPVPTLVDKSAMPIYKIVQLLAILIRRIFFPFSF